MKQEDFKTIWQVPKYLPYVQPPLTDKILSIAEKKIGYPLPKEYVDLLKIQNGGYIRFELPEFYNEQLYGIGPYFPSLTDFDWSDFDDIASFEFKGLVPFDSDGHCFLCFDYRENKTEPRITMIDTECDEETPVADNFKEYLSLLELNSDGVFVIKTSSAIEEVVNSIAGILPVEFEAPDYFNHGYASYRAKVNDCLIWISPNKVPAGFVRQGDKRYDELKSQMETSASRFPEIPEDYLFISASNQATWLSILDKLTANGIEIVSLKSLVG